MDLCGVSHYFTRSTTSLYFHPFDQMPLMVCYITIIYMAEHRVCTRCNNACIFSNLRVPHRSMNAPCICPIRTKFPTHVVSAYNVKRDLLPRGWLFRCHGKDLTAHLPAVRYPPIPARAVEHDILSPTLYRPRPPSRG